MKCDMCCSTDIENCKSSRFRKAINKEGLNSNYK